MAEAQRANTDAEPNADPGAEEAWAGLTAELDAWAAAGRTVTLFWRDDDATTPGPALDRLIETTLAAQAPLMLAVIPARMEPALGERIADAHHVRPAQHGWAHVNHAKGTGTEGAWELGLQRGSETLMAELEEGRARLASLFGAQFLPVMVPPWNNIDPGLLPALAQGGWRGVSAWGPRAAAHTDEGLAVNNAHVDPIRWKDGARFAGTAKTLGQLVGHLAARRTGTVDAAEATGLLTHHAALDEAGWDFVLRLAAAIGDHPVVRWLDPGALFPPA